MKPVYLPPRPLLSLEQLNYLHDAAKKGPRVSKKSVVSMIQLLGALLVYSAMPSPEAGVAPVPVSQAAPRLEAADPALVLHAGVLDSRWVVSAQSRFGHLDRDLAGASQTGLAFGSLLLLTASLLSRLLPDSWSWRQRNEDICGIYNYTLLRVL